MPPTPVTLFEESLAQGGFYVPSFEILIEGVGLPRDVLRDVVQVTYKDDVKQLDSFELTVNNWDADINDFKYVGSETREALESQTVESERFRIFDPCNKEVKLRMGYMEELRVMLTGNFTTMEPNFPTSGGPTLAVRGLNVLHELRRKPYTESWVDMRDSDIALNIATLKDKQTKQKRFPLPIVIDESARDLEPKIPFVSQRNQTDIEFLMGRARERGYVLFIQEADPNVRGSVRRLYFGPSQEGQIPGLRDVTFELHWGRSLIDFKPTLTTANQVRSVTVNGWNRRTKQPISEKVTLDDPKIRQNKDLHELLKQCDPREDVVVDEPVFTKEQAKNRALAILTDRQKEMVKASGTTVGLPDLRAGKKVVIKGLGARFSGTYFITDTTHTIGGSGYTTKFNARREDEEGGG